MEAAGVMGASLVDDIDKGPMSPSHEDDDGDEEHSDDPAA